MTHILPASPCPTCGARNNAATCVSDDDARPATGDVTLCIECGELLVFDENVNPVLPTPEQLKTIFADASRAALIRHSQRMIRG